MDVAESSSGKKYLPKISQFFARFGDVDFLICAGDVSPYLDEFESTLEFLRATVKAGHYLVVPGNHDIWIEELIDASVDFPPPLEFASEMQATTEDVFNAASKRKYEKDLPKVTKRVGFHYLPGQPLLVEEFNMGLVGSIGWYDYTFRNEKHDEQFEDPEQMYASKLLPGIGVFNDLFFAKWGMPDKAVVAYLMRQLRHDTEALLMQNGEQRPLHLLGIFHHVPFRQGVVYKNQLWWDFFSAFIGAECFGNFLIEQQFTTVFHGHTHFRLQYSVQKTQVHCHPIGYPSEWENRRNIHGELQRRVKLVTL